MPKPTAEEKRIEEAKEMRLKMDQGGCSKIMAGCFVLTLSLAINIFLIII